MANISKKRRQFKIKKRQNRSKKLRVLKEKYLKAETKNEKDKLMEKFEKIAPHISAKEYFGRK